MIERISRSSRWWCSPRPHVQAREMARAPKIAASILHPPLGPSYLYSECDIRQHKKNPVCSLLLSSPIPVIAGLRGEGSIWQRTQTFFMRWHVCDYQVINLAWQAQIHHALAKEPLEIHVPKASLWKSETSDGWWNHHLINFNLAWHLVLIWQIK